MRILYRGFERKVLTYVKCMNQDEIRTDQNEVEIRVEHPSACQTRQTTTTDDNLSLRMRRGSAHCCLFASIATRQGIVLCSYRMQLVTSRREGLLQTHVICRLP